MVIAFFLTGLSYVASGVALRIYKNASVDLKANIQNLFVIILLASFVGSGAFYALYTIDNENPPLAVNSAGEKMRVLRFGADFSLIVAADGTVHLIRTSNIVDLSSVKTDTVRPSG